MKKIEIGSEKEQKAGFKAFLPHKFPPQEGFPLPSEILKKGTEATRLHQCSQKNPGSPVALKSRGHVRQSFEIPALAQGSRTVYAGFKSTLIAAPI